MEYTLTRETAGQRFRDAWINAIYLYGPPNPKPAYTAPWDSIQTWEQHACADTYLHAAYLIHTSGGHTADLTRIERGQFITAIWNAHTHHHYPDHPDGYTAPWDSLSHWRKNVNIAIFATIAEQLDSQ